MCEDDRIVLCLANGYEFCAFLLLDNALPFLLLRSDFTLSGLSRVVQGKLVTILLLIDRLYRVDH